MKTKLQLHMDSLAKVFTNTWYYSSVLIPTGGGLYIESVGVTNPYNLSFDGKSAVVAASALYGASPTDVITASYKLTDENGSDFITFYDSAGTVIEKALIAFPGNNANAIINAVEMDLYMDKGTFSPVFGDSYDQTYATITKAIRYYRRYN